MEKCKTTPVRVHISLDPVADAQLIAWLDGQRDRNKSAAVRIALYDYIDRHGMVDAQSGMELKEQHQ